MDTVLASFAPERLLTRTFPVVTQEVTPHNCMLYALGVGYGADPMDREDLPFVFEEPDLLAAPSMPVVLAGPGFWARQPDTGIDWRRMLHGETELELHDTIPTGGSVNARTRVTRVIDKGAGKGALILTERVVRDAAGKPIATVRGTSFARGNGGCGGDSGPQAPPHPIPDRHPDVELDTITEPRAALLYRLCGDPNPLHADPDVAAAAGFDRPILHGLCSFGIAVRALLKACCAMQPRRLRSVKLRFTGPVFPGDTIRTQMWRDGDVVSFRASVPHRGIVVLNNGRAEIR